MSEITFEAWPKIPRLNREMIVTEKIDGTNAAVIIERGAPSDYQTGWTSAAEYDGGFYKVGAQSRTRLITPEDDNYGFARWVRENAQALVETLGEGRHFGEWWGNGIQRGYGLPKGDKRFSLFNTSRWGDVDVSAVPGLGVVPVLYAGGFSHDIITNIVGTLREHGSVVGQGYRAEGVVVYLPAARQLFKVLVENDEIPKGLAEA